MGDLPPNFQHCNLKGRSFTPSLDLSIHNVQGIDVWAPKGPKPYGGKASAYKRNEFLKCLIETFQITFGLV